MPTEKEVNELVEKNFPLAKFMASKWLHIDFDEALSIAMHALHEAAMSYDPACGYKFSTWAGQQMKWKAGRYVTRMNTKGRGGGVVHVHLDAEIGFDGGSTYSEVIADEKIRHVGDEIGDAEEADLMAECVKHLDEKERQIVEMRFGLNENPVHTYDQIAQRFDCSKQRVEQILKNKVFPRLKAIRQSIMLKARMKSAAPAAEAIRRRSKEWPSHTPEARRAYRIKNRDCLRETWRNWQARNRDKMREWRREWRLNNREKVNRQKMVWYYRYRERISAERKVRYKANPEPLRARSRANHWRFREKILPRAAAYREKNRAYLRQKAIERNASLPDGVVRNYLAKDSGFTLKPDSFTSEQVNEKRNSIVLKRQKIGIPNCPHCHKTARKDGKFRPSGHQRYSCRHCKKCFGVTPQPPVP